MVQQLKEANKKKGYTELMMRTGELVMDVGTVLDGRKAVRVLHKGLMYRYNTHDDFGCPSSAFTICTFWLLVMI